jgi:alkanesulfonate monooxygenase SsuD/methylene tetrahydromethanopterin reductase-like flavin-dependent oxidoreductase (luciferase family)
MRIGVHLTRYDVPAAEVAALLAALARAADEAGVDVLSLPDHFLQVPYVGPVDQQVLEGYTALAFMAAHSERVELQLLDGGVAFRHPGVLARTVATLDVLSGGRARLCLGPGWYEREHRAVGVPFPPLRDRFELLEEALQVVRRTWSDEDALCSPRPLRRVPVMVTGVGERKALRIVARYADACHLFAGGDSDASFVAGKLAVLREHCEAEGRDHASLSRTILWTDSVDPSRPRPFLDRMGEMAEVGVDEVHVQVGDRPVDLVRALGEHVVPLLHRL